MAALMIACGGGSSAGTSPSPTPTPAPNTITITSAGVNPATLTVALGSQVTFVNNDVQVHDMLSDPHPEHTDCPELNQVGSLAPRQSKQSGNLNTAKTCGYHDHELFSDPKWQGKIIIQ
jgi:plastocyanin